MINNKPIFLTIAVIAVVAVGYQLHYKKPLDIGQQNAYPNMGDREIIRINNKEIQYSNSPSDSPEPHLDVNMEYVQLSGMSDQALQQRINQQLKKDVGADQEYHNQSRYVKTLSVNIEGDVLNVVSEGTVYINGDAGAQDFIYSSNINLKTGEEIALNQVLKQGYQETLTPIVKGILKENNLGENFTQLNNNQCYYFSADSLSLCFNEYDIGAGSEGAIIVDVPLNKIEGVIDLAGLTQF